MNTDELITIKRYKKYPSLSVEKKKKKVFYDNLWNKDEGLLECRGRVIDDCGKTVINPFTKIFNYLENGTSIDDEERCLCVDKINGFLYNTILAIVSFLSALPKKVFLFL